jgi:NAD(P)-dependent dehydrogenase (short-subunit alcohol dehydrogenase family)
MTRSNSAVGTVDLPFLGMTALVTGGARGLGEAISRRLASAGARVALVGRDKDRLAALAAELPHEPVIIPADLAEPDAPLAAPAGAIEELGRLDVLVNNAGLSLGGPSHLLSPRTIGIDLGSPVYTTFIGS